ncbi:unnamed protein product [Arctia plantaginis]|uniref:Elongation of very long chain fatty acids protein n=1 Tax=Arctia plantaginis TaxID=874455 RepID=A0A8S0Z7Y7_ARCPL|nr:unnamed protein product [Arctia plantaginis]
MITVENVDYEIVRNESFWDFKGYSDAVDSWPFMASPYPMMAITCSYLLFVLKIGPAYMKNRQPYHLRNIIVAYNFCQVGVSVYVVYLACKLQIPHGWISKTCLMEREDTRNEIMKLMYYYFLRKISELSDTIFFVLRKKNNQASFLHVYHHSMMVVTAWGILKYEPTYPSVFLRNINSLVHVIMYLYYGLSSFPSLAKYLWWKKYITSLQLIQFLLIILHLSLTYVYSECTPSFGLAVVIYGNTLFMTVLFSRFYLETYKKRDVKKRE